LSGLDVEVDLLEHGLPMPKGVGEGHVAEHHLRAHHLHCITGEEGGSEGREEGGRDWERGGWQWQMHVMWNCFLYKKRDVFWKVKNMKRRTWGGCGLWGEGWLVVDDGGLEQVDRRIEGRLGERAHNRR
jgi:hypothetical protein